VNFEFASEIYVVRNPRESWEPPPVGPTCVNCGADFRFCFDWAVSRWVPTEVRCNCETDSRRPIKLVTETGAHEEGGFSDPL
jgi:hypothetical protein